MTIGDVSSRILAAATLAEQAAAATQTDDRWTAYVRDRDVHIDGGGHVALIGRETWPEVWPQARLIAASGPSHWGAVAELLRITVVEGYIVQELLDLVDQIFRDLGGGS